MSQLQDVQQKWEQLKTYIPFVVRMISKLECRNNPDKGEHLDRLKGLLKFLTNPDSRLQNIEMLDRMEKIIKGMYKSVGKTAATGVAPPRPVSEDGQVAESERRDSSNERNSYNHRSDSHSSSHRKTERRDHHSSSHRDHHSSSSSSRKDSGHRGSRSGDRDYHHHRKSSREQDEKHRHRSSSREDRRYDKSKSSRDGHYSQSKQDEKETVTKRSTDDFKMRERELFGDDNDVLPERKTLSTSREEVKDRFIKPSSLLDLPMPPMQDGSRSRMIYGVVDMKDDPPTNIQMSPSGQPGSLQQRASQSPQTMSKVELLKRKIGLIEDPPKPKYNFHEFKFNESSLGSLSLADREPVSLFPSYKGDTQKESPFRSPRHTSSQSPIPETASPKPDATIPSFSNRTFSAPSPLRSVTATLKPTDVPLPSYPHIPPSKSETPQSPEHDTPLSPDENITSIPLDNKKVPAATPEVAPLAQVNMDAIQKALNFINAHDKSKRQEPKSISYRYEDFVGPASGSGSSKSEFYNPEDPWTNPADSLGSGDVDLRNKKDVDLRNKKDVDLRQIPRSFVPPAPPPPPGSMFQIHKRLSPIHPTSIPTKFSTPMNVSYPNMPSAEAQWYSSHDNRRSSTSTLPPRDTKDVDMRTLMGTATSQSSSSFSSSSTRFTSNIPSTVDPPSPSSDINKNLYKKPEIRKVEVTSQKAEPGKVDVASKKPDGIKGNDPVPVRARVAHDQDKLIKLGQNKKGVAVSQLETYKQKRERMSIPAKHPHVKSPESPVPSVSKNSPISVLDALLPTPAEDEKEKESQSLKNEKSPLSSESPISKVKDPLPVKPTHRKDSTEKGPNQIDPKPNKPPTDHSQKSSIGQETSKSTAAKDSPVNVPSKPVNSLQNLRSLPLPPNWKKDSGPTPTSKEGTSNRPPYSSRPKTLDSATLQYNKSIESKIKDHRADMLKDSRPEKQMKDPKTENPGLRDTSLYSKSIDTKIKDNRPDMLKDPRPPDRQMKDPRPPDRQMKDPRTENPVLRDPRVETPRDPRSEGKPRISRPDGISRDIRAEGLLSRDPRSDNIPRSNWPDRPDVSRDHRSNVRDPRSEPFHGMDQRHSIPVRRDPRLNQDFSRDPRGNTYPPISRDPRMGQMRDMPPRVVQPRPPYNMGPMWNNMGGGGLLKHPYPNSSIAPVAPIPVAPIQPTQIKFGPSPQNSAIGQTFTCIMMQGLPHFTNSSHIYIFFEEYLLSDICIELDQSYNCKGTAYVHFPTHISAKTALEKENGKFIHGYKIYLRICSLGILNQAKRTHDLQNIDREKYLNILPKPRGNGNPYYKKPKSPPPVIKEPPPPQELPQTGDQALTSKISKDEDTTKVGYSSLCGVKMDGHTSKGLQSFKIPKLKKPTPQADEPPAANDSKNVTSESFSKTISSGDKEKIDLKSTPPANKEKKNSKLSKAVLKIASSSSESESDDLVKLSPITKKNRRYRKIIKATDSDSNSDKEESPMQKLSTKIKKRKARLSLETDDSDSEDSMIIDESAVAVESHQDSDSSSSSSSEDVSKMRERVFDNLMSSIKKPKSTSGVRGRKRRGVKLGSRGGIGRGAGKVRGGKSPTRKTGKRGRGRKVNMFGTEEKKITRQKQVVLSPTIKLKVLIPTPTKLIYSLDGFDKLPKRLPPRRRNVPSPKSFRDITETEREKSPVPSDTSDTSSNASFRPDSAEPPSPQESDHESNGKPDEVPEVLSPSSPEEEKQEVVKVNEIAESSTANDTKEEKEKEVIVPEKVKRQKRNQNLWQKGYKRSSSSLPDIKIGRWKRIYSKPLRQFKSVKLSERRELKNSSKVVEERNQTTVKQSSSVPTSTTSSYVDQEPISLFDTGIMDDTDSPDLTQITPSITDKEMSIFNELPELSSFASVIGSTKVPRPFTLEANKEKTIQMISDALVETANKFTEKESQQQTRSIPEATSNSKELQRMSDDEEESLSSKVNELVASLDKSFTSDSPFARDASGIERNCKPQVRSEKELKTGSTPSTSVEDAIPRQNENGERSSAIKDPVECESPSNSEVPLPKSVIPSVLPDTTKSQLKIADEPADQGDVNSSQLKNKSEVNSETSTLDSNNKSQSNLPENSPLVKKKDVETTLPSEPKAIPPPRVTQQAIVKLHDVQKPSKITETIIGRSDSTGAKALHEPDVPDQSEPQDQNEWSQEKGNTSEIDLTTTEEKYDKELVQEKSDKVEKSLESETISQVQESVKETTDEVEKCVNEVEGYSQTYTTANDKASLQKKTHEAEESKEKTTEAEKPIPETTTESTDHSSSDNVDAENTTNIDSATPPKGLSDAEVEEKDHIPSTESSFSSSYPLSLDSKVDKLSTDVLSSSAVDAGAESDLDDLASLGLASMSSFPDDTSVVSNDGRESTPDPSSQGSKRASKRDKDKSFLGSGLIERRRITRGSMIIPEVHENILWDDGGAVDLFQCDQCDYVGKLRVSHLINFHTDREVPCEFRKEDYSPLLRDFLGPSNPPAEKVKINLSWVPQKMIFDEEIECKMKDCDYNTNSRFDFFYHVLEHKPQAVSSMFHCRLCNFMNDNLTQFYDHVSSHTGEYRHTCVRCGQRAYCIEALIHHHKDYHGSQSKEFSSADMVLEDGWPYIHVCRTCHHAQISLEKIEEHLQSKHTGKCDYIKANMSRHITLHMEKKKEPEGSTSAKRKEAELDAPSKPATKVLKKLPVKTDSKTLKVPRKLRKGRRLRKKAKPPGKAERADKVEEKEKVEEAEVAKEVEVIEDTEKVNDKKNAEDSEKVKGIEEVEEEEINNVVDTEMGESETVGEADDVNDLADDDDETDKPEPAENLANVPVFLGHAKQSESSEKAEEKEAEEMVNRILLNNYTSRSSLEIKKKIWTLDNILRKVDSESESNSSFATEEGKEVTPEITTSETKPVENKMPGLIERLRDVRAKGAQMSQHVSTGGSEAPPVGGDVSRKARDSRETTSQSPKRGQKRKADDVGKPLTGIISRLKTQLAEEDVLKKIKEKEQALNSALSDSNQTSDGGDSDSDHLVICEDEGDANRGPSGTTPTPMGGLRVKPRHELFAEPTTSNDISGQEPFKCRITDCSYAGSNNNNMGAHAWVSHDLYFCIFPSCSFMTVSDKLYNLHFENGHKIRKFGCPLNCENLFMMSPSDMIKHMAKEHFPNLNKGKTTPQTNQSSAEISPFPRIESYHTLDPKSASQMFSNEEMSPASSCPEGKQPTLTVKDQSGSSVASQLSPKSDIKPILPSLNLKKEVQDFPGVETLPNTPPTVPLLQLFIQFQTHRSFVLYTGSKAPEVFKCMVRSCTFVTDDQAAFERHCDEHIGAEHRCCYCFVKIASGKMLVDHILTEHSHCPFQCKYCLYRAYTKIYLGVHLRKFHPEKEARYIKVNTRKTEPPSNPSIENFVHPYKCTIASCTFRSVDADAFKAHTAVHGGNMKNVIMPCTFCEIVYDVDGLLRHMTVHMMNEFQCPYCLFGEAEREKLLTHLLNCHPGRPGKVLLRRQVSTSSGGGGTRPSPSPSPAPPAAPSTPSVTITTGLSAAPSSIGSPPPSSPSKGPATYAGGSVMVTVTTSSVSSFTNSGVTTTRVGAGSPALATSTAPAPVSFPSPLSAGLATEHRRDSDGFPSGFSSPGFSPNATPPTTPTSEPSSLDQTGLTGNALYRCGNERCEYSCTTQLLLKEHLQVCDFSRDSPQLRCFHCSKNFRHLSGLLDHIKVHGPKRYLCGVEGCDYRCTLPHYYKNHMKQVHHHSGYKIVLKDFSVKNPETQEFIVYPKDVMSTFKEPHKRRRNEYGVDDMDKIPRVHVAYQEFKCYHCMYSSKVRLNMIKHLKLHQKYPSGMTVTDSLHEMVAIIPAKQPINPVPRLERKELMFDKMMNLAGSSFEEKRGSEENELRLKNPIPQKELDALPGYVPDEQLNSCGIDGCKYQSCDEVMLKCHIRTLHSDVETFPCPHCHVVFLTVDKIGAHMKLHGESLYRCGWCPFLTPRKALVERHLTENHYGKTPFDFCIRRSQAEKEDGAKEAKSKTGSDINDASDAKSLLEPPTAEEDNRQSKLVEKQQSDPSPSVLNQEAQWQCGICPFRSVIQSEMVNHTSVKHAIKSQYKCGYCNVRSSVRTAFDTHFAAKHPDKAFRVLCMYYRLDSDDIEPLAAGGSTSHEPLWKKNDPDRKKQIRGIFLDDDESDQELGFLGIQPGQPLGEEFVCPKCHSFKTPCISTFRSHLCKEANYQRFECAECGITNPLLPTLRRHYTKTHGSQFASDCYITLPVESTLEAWVESIISHQQHLIKIWKETGGESTSSSPQKSGRRSSLLADAEESPGAVLHDSGIDKSKYTCNICGVECRTGSGLKSHKTAMHQTKFKCQLCPFSSNMELAIQNHCALKHPKHDGQDSGVTPLASPSEHDSSSLENETMPMKYECPHCSFRTKTTRVYYAHVQTHTKFRAYLCEYCGKRFENQRDGNRHSHWKHSSLPAKIIYSPVSEESSEKDESGVTKEAEVPKAPEQETIPPPQLPLAPPPPPPPEPKPVTLCYSCCHCTLKGPYNFVEEHLKAQHRDLPFLVRKEEEKRLYLEVYKYRCGHCSKDSDSLMEAMDHWVKNHVTLDFRFSLSLASSTVIRTETETPNTPATPSATTEKQQTTGLKDASSGSSSSSSSTTKSSSSSSSLLSPVRSGAEGTSSKPDSSSAPSGPSDLEEDDEMNESLSSTELIEGGTDSEVEINKVTSSTSEKDVFAKCSYCRRVSSNQSEIYEHIRTAHPDKPMKTNVYPKGEYERLFRGLFECELCGEQGTASNMNKHVKKLHPGTNAKVKRITKAKQKEKICFRCDVCSHVVKTRKSIKSHMDRIHPEQVNTFTKMLSESSLLLRTKQSWKCSYCGDTAATMENLKSHHNFLHSHLPLSYINMRDQALQSIHKSASAQPTKEPISQSFSSPSPLQPPTRTITPAPAQPQETPSFVPSKTRHTARKSFPMKFTKKRQIATKSTSGKLQLVRLRQVKNQDNEDLSDRPVSSGENLLPSEPDPNVLPSQLGHNNDFNLDEIYASVNLLGSTPMRLSVTQLSALINLNPKVLVEKQ